MGILFGKYPERSPKDMVYEWCRILRKEGNNLERDLRSLNIEEQKAKRSLLEADGRGDNETCLILMKQIERSEEAIKNIHINKAHLNSIQMHLKSQLSVLKVTGSFKKSTEVMQALQALERRPLFVHTIQEMTKEMERAGIIERTLNKSISRVVDGRDRSSEVEKTHSKDVSRILPWIVKIFFGVSLSFIFRLFYKLIRPTRKSI